MNISDKDKEEYKQLVHYHLNVIMEFKQVNPNYIRGSKYLWSLKIQDEAAKILEKYKNQLSLIDKNIKVGKGRSSPESKNRDAKHREFTRFFTKAIKEMNPPLIELETKPEIVSNPKSEIEPLTFENGDFSIIQKSKSPLLFNTEIAVGSEPNLPQKQIVESTPKGSDDNFWIKQYKNTPQPILDPIPSAIWPIEESTPCDTIKQAVIPTARVDHIQSVAVSEYSKSMRLLDLPLLIIDCPHEHLENLCNWLVDNYNLIPNYDHNYSPSSDDFGIICKEFLDLWMDLKSYYDICGHDIQFYDFCKSIDGNLSITRILYNFRYAIKTPQDIPQVETPIKRPVGRPRVENHPEIKQPVGRPKVYNTESDLYLKTLISNVEYAKKLLIDANYELKSYKLSLKGGTNE